jgi:hypothetical protein
LSDSVQFVKIIKGLMLKKIIQNILKKPIKWKTFIKRENNIKFTDYCKLLPQEN